MIRLAPVSLVLASETARSVRPPATIDTQDDDQRNYWAYRFGISSGDLDAAIEAVGPSVSAIRRHLGK
ncbi:DUF3606 domain-containing protein [Tardiphaga sp.]|jgi:hypothetical protein|uniref:DUF3606 domain-containing protein n=1 Tax=Tardiphaga sp. TaxID=1926292 RepID=UPI0037D99F69